LLFSLCPSNLQSNCVNDPAAETSDGDFLGSHSYSDDWNIYLVPLRGFRKVLSINNLVEMERLERGPWLRDDARIRRRRRL
jgi:hypothetical protein